MDANDDMTCPSNAVALSRKQDVILQELPAVGVQVPDKACDTTTIVVGKDDSHNHLKITQHLQLGNDGALELQEGGCSLAVLEAKEMDQITMNLGGVPRPLNTIQHLSSAGKDGVT